MIGPAPYKTMCDIGSWHGLTKIYASPPTLSWSPPGHHPDPAHPCNLTEPPEHVFVNWNGDFHSFVIQPDQPIGPVSGSLVTVQ